MTIDLDMRRHAIRADLADIALKGRIPAARFVSGMPARVAVPVADLLRRPEADGPADTQLLLGEAVRVFEDGDGWSWVQSDHDAYVGYVRSSSLAEPGPAPTHRVSARATFIYPEPDLRSRPAMSISMASRLSIMPDAELENRGTIYAKRTGGGYVISGHVSPIDMVVSDFVTVAERFLHVPYLWAGRSAFGLDCSALVQLALDSTGVAAPRDSDMQEAETGEPVEGGVDAALQRGDLVFWNGHVGIMCDDRDVLHASGNTMCVSRERLADAVDRIERLCARPTSVRRLTCLSATT